MLSRHRLTRQRRARTLALLPTPSLDLRNTGDVLGLWAKHDVKTTQHFSQDPFTKAGPTSFAPVAAEGEAIANIAEGRLESGESSIRSPALLLPALPYAVDIGLSHTLSTANEFSDNGLVSTIVAASMAPYSARYGNLVQAHCHNICRDV